MSDRRIYGPTDPIVSKLIKFAAVLARGEGVPREFDVENFYASTPQAERKRIRKAIDAIEETHKIWAMELRRIADELNARGAAQETVVKCPECNATNSDDCYFDDGKPPPPLCKYPRCSREKDHLGAHQV